MVGIALSYTNIGIDAYQITVECDGISGLFVVNVVGMASSAVKESKDRVFAAIKNSGFDYVTKRYTINLAPADMKEDSSALEATKILSVAGLFKHFRNGILTTRPFRSPHHTISDVAVINRVVIHYWYSKPYP